MKHNLLGLLFFFSIGIVNSQIAYQASDIIVCDDNNDGLSSFDLTLNTFEILGNQNPSDFEVTYHLSLSEAENNINPIAYPSSYYNTMNPQTIYARVTSVVTGGYDTTSFDVEVLSVSINYPTPLEICDDNLDGFAVFDLNSKNEEILNTLSDVIISYYETVADASNMTNPIPNSSSYTNVTSYTQTIYATVEDLITNCFTTTSLELIALDCTDSDFDGVIDSYEDLNSNGDLNDDDTDQDSIANYLDADDDGDNVATLDEVNISSGRSSTQTHLFIDTDSDLIENYLDDDDDGDGVLTIDEDYNGNGDPTDDDTDTSGVPDYLETNVALSLDDVKFNALKLYPNPSKEMVYIKNINTTSKISVYSIEGRRMNISIQKNSTNEFQFNTKKLNRGVYLVKIQNKEQQKTIKLMVIN